MAERGDGERTGDEDIRLYSSRDRVMAVDSQIKKRILELLQERDYSFDELVSLCGRAKSTISVHVHDLISTGLIASQTDPDDNRKKILTLSSTPIGRLTNLDRHAVVREENIEKSAALPFEPGDIASFFRWGVRVFRTEAMALGINIDPVLERTGWEIGRVLVPLVYDPDLSQMVHAMHEFWSVHGLGSVTLSGSDPIALTVQGCFECEDLPVTGHGACSFDIGVLSAIFSNFLKGPVRITEIECYSAGNDHCRFIIEPKKPELEG
ncbi:MAG TPA: 4-vinyl reductase [Methanospirillum sp.]|uniref:V4R domain-containing protein n=1 Tax=Methanospirillum sp. TaxID=45200 RepID=UPI002B6A2F41|nr:V4R domain-containing protein [Methanospirillum sp.]HOJ97088.1 4-vinyl reductase [Methanospirillum sp.]HOL41930.1 4-vinyl reductase [Methanospirillum sp.]HPP78047.1 4-vinyl reductase [Methanospirillum sp.]